MSDKLSYANRLLEVFSKAIHGSELEKLQGTYLLARRENETWKIYSFRDKLSAERFRDKEFAEKERVPTFQPFYVLKKGEGMTSMFGGGMSRTFRVAQE